MVGRGGEEWLGVGERGRRVGGVAQDGGAGELKLVRHLFMSAAFLFLSPTDVGERAG
jgi:hypothetical protein